MRIYDLCNQNIRRLEASGAVEVFSLVCFVVHLTSEVDDIPTEIWL